MVFLRYLTCFVAALAVVSYTVYLEVHTPVVYKVKSTLGLDTSNIDAARADLSEPGFIEVVQGFFKDHEGVPTLSQAMAGAPAEQQSKQLPAPLVGWMRQDADVDLKAVKAFEDDYLRGGLSDGQDVYQDSGLRMSGAYYYRESMELLVTISSVPRSMELAASQLLSPSDFSGASENTVRFNGATLPVKRHSTSGFGLVQTLIGDRVMVQLRGDVPDAVFEAYLEAFDWGVLASL